MEKSRSTAARHPTLSDVARHAGVGTTTVSRVINGGARVSSKTFALVSGAIRELGFVPNLAARVLKGEQSKTIGLIVPSIADPFFSSCAEAIQTVARSFGSLVVVTVTHNDAAMELENIDTLFRRIDGLLIVPSHTRNPALIERLSSISIPVVCFDRPLHHNHLPSVLTNNYQAARELTEHLLGHGYDRILCFGGEASFHTIGERSRGYAAAMRSARSTPLLDVSPGQRNTEETIASLRRHLESPRSPRAIFCLKNTTTIDVYNALQGFGISVPGEVALAGFDDFLLAATLRPSITVVRQPVGEIGRTAAKLLFEQLASGTSKVSPAEGNNTVRLRGELVLRASCGCGEPASVAGTVSTAQARDPASEPNTSSAHPGLAPASRRVHKRSQK